MTVGTVKVRPALRRVRPIAEAEAPLPGCLRVAGPLGSILLAAAVGLLPFTVFGAFLVSIADGAGRGVAVVGGLRGLGGLSGLLIGAALAPLLDRFRREWVLAAGLVLLGTAALLGATGRLEALALFCLLVGAATSVLSPALTASAADRFGSEAAAARAATLVTATQSLTAVLAPPLVALAALLWGWKGDLVAIAVLSLALAAWFALRPHRAGYGPRRQWLGYLATYRALARVPGALPLLAVGLLRTAAFMGYLAYLAAFYHAKFALAPGAFALVWALSGASFFVGSLLAGRFVNSPDRWWGRPERLLVLGLLVALAAIGGFYFASSLPAALLLTSLLGASHATVAACVVSLLVRRCGPLRGSALGVNAAGMSLGVFVGAALGAVGLGVVGYPGIAAVLGTLTLGALSAALLVGRTPG
jgi:predicted MFS family arabinose efflux permease